MQLPPAVLKLLAAAKLSPEQLVIVNQIITMVSDPIDKNRVKSAIRQARWRAKRRLRNVSVTSTVDVSVTSTQPSKINGVARVKDNPLLPSSPPPEGSREPSSGGEPAPARKASRKPKILIPENWHPSEDGLEYARARIPADQIPEEIEGFRDRNTSRGETYADWGAAWRTWCRNFVKFNSGRPHNNGYPSITGHNQRVLREAERREAAARERRRSGTSTSADLFLIQGRSEDDA